MNKKTKQKRSTISARAEGARLSLIQDARKRFMKGYPRNDALANKDDSRWELVLCLFFALLFSGVLCTRSPVETFYSILLQDIDLKRGSIRIGGRRRSGQQGNSEGHKVYLSAPSMVYLLLYLIRLSATNPSVWNADGTTKLVPEHIFKKSRFGLRKNNFLDAIYGGIERDNNHPSLEETVNGISVELLKQYPAFLVSVLTATVIYTSTPDSAEQNQKDPLKPINGYSGKSYSRMVASQRGPDMQPVLILEGYRDLLWVLSKLSASSTPTERHNIADLVGHRLGKYTPYDKRSAGVDWDNFNIAAKWLSSMLIEANVLMQPNMPNGPSMLIQQKKYSVNTIKTYFQHVSDVLRYHLSGESLNDISHTDMDIILDSCASSSTANGRRSAMKSFLTFTEKYFEVKPGYIAWDKLKVSHDQDNKDISILWPSDVDRILNYAHDKQTRVAVIMGFYLGMRIGEIAGLTLDDLSFLGEIFIQMKISKTAAGKRRLLLDQIMPDCYVQEVLSFYFERFHLRRGKNGMQLALFVDEKGKAFHNPQTLAARVEKTMRNAKIAKATCHTLRHSFGSILLLRWARAHKDELATEWSELERFSRVSDKVLLAHGLFDIAGLMGHADVRTTVRNYLHTVDLLQKAYLHLHEMAQPVFFNYRQAIALIVLTGLSDKRARAIFPERKNVVGVSAARLSENLLQRVTNNLFPVAPKG